MPTPKQIKDKALSSVNGVITALEMYPETKETNTYLSNNISSNPIDLLIDFFKSTKGYDFLIEKVSEYITLVPEILEASVKGILLTNIQSMLSCSINPIINEKMIQEGVVFDMNKIDLFNIFEYSPIDHSVNNPGRYYYFGCNPEDNIEILDDVKYSEDFNAVLWYCKNNPGERVVWKRRDDRSKDTKVPDKSNPFKQAKSNGIVTLQYNGRSSGLTNSENDAYYIQEPMENCIHVFYGCCVPLQDGVETTIRRTIAQKTANITDLNSLVEMINTCYGEFDKYQREQTTAIINNGNDYNIEINNIIKNCEDSKRILNKLKDIVMGTTSSGSSKSIADAISDASKGDKEFEDKSKEGFNFSEINRSITIPPDLMSTNLKKEEGEKFIEQLKLEGKKSTNYPKATTNYYHKHLMMEFNYDFVMSMKLFDEKVLTAQLLDALTNCLKLCAGGLIHGDLSGNVGLSKNGNINISFQQQFVEAQLREMVTRILESDDSFVNDCFFTFTNDSYNALIQEVEMSRSGLHTFDGMHGTNSVSAEEIMESLNNLSSEANKMEMKDIIKGSIYKAASCTTPHGAGEINTTMNINTLFGFDVTGGFNANLNFIEQLLTKLVYVIVMTIMSPKIYLLLMANLKVVGQEPNFDLAKFMQQFGELIKSLIRGIRDEILEFLRKEVLKIMQELASKLAIKLTIEQYQYYTELLLHAIDCIKIHGHQYDWAQDDVNYADITELSDTINQEC